MPDPVSFRDPTYADLARRMEAKHGLPPGLLLNIITKGERSNADAVSSAGARTVFQIIPSTRDAFRSKYGIDAYLSAENAAEVAALHLKEDLERSGGDVAEAVASYHAGPSGTNRGPVNRAYVGRVLNGMGQTAAPKGTALPPNVLEAYNDPNSDMTPEQRQKIAAGVKAGQISLGEGQKLSPIAPAQPKPNAAPMSPEIAQQYNNHSEMTDAQRDVIDRNIERGFIVPPQGVALKRPDPRTFGDYAGIAGRAFMEGAGQLVEAGAAALSGVGEAELKRAGVNAPTGNTVAEGAADALNLAKPGTPGEKLLSSTIEGAVTAAPFGVVGAGRNILGSVALDTAAGAAGGGAVEAAGQAGAPLPVQIAAGLAGGVGGFAGARRVAKEVAERIGSQATKIIETTPHATLIDETGKLTDEGVEAAVRAKVTPEEFKTALDETAPPEVPMTDRPDLGPPTEADATRLARLETVPVKSLRGTQLGRRWGQREPATPKYEALSQHPFAVRTKDGTLHLFDGHHRADAALARGDKSLPVFVVDEGTFTPVPRRVESEFKWREEGPPKYNSDELDALRVELGGASKHTAAQGARGASSVADEIPLTRGEETKDFGVYSREQQLKAMESPEGTEARAWYAQRDEAIENAVLKYRSGIDDPTLTPALRGQAIREGLTEMKDAGKAGVTALYREAKALVEKAQSEMGDNTRAMLDLDTEAMKPVLRELLIDHSIPEATRDGLRQIAAQYGLIGRGKTRTFEDGTTVVEVPEIGGTAVKTIPIPRPVEHLSIANAEEFRQAINRLYKPGDPQTGRPLALANLADEATAAAVEKVAVEGLGELGDIAKKARKAHQTQKQTFEAKDAIQRVIDFKKGTQTPQVPDERVARALLNSTAELKKAKAVLLSNPTQKSRAAWTALKAQGVAEIFEKAFVVNARQGEGAISGAKLNTAINKFGPEKLKTLLEPAEFDELMALRRRIGDATIPLPNTTNPSGSGWAVIRHLTRQAAGLAQVARVIPGAGMVMNVADGASQLAKMGREAAEAKETLKGITGAGKQTR